MGAGSLPSAAGRNRFWGTFAALFAAVTPVFAAPPFASGLPTTPALFLTGGRGIVTIRQGDLSPTEFACETFTAFASAKVGAVTVTTSGLGSARLAPGALADCDHPPAAAAAQLLVQALPSGTALTVFVPAETAISGLTVEGKIVAFNPQTRAELGLKLRTEDSWLRRLGKWLLFTLLGGVMIPALLTLQFGYLGYLAQQRWRDRQDARKAFAAANAKPEMRAGLESVFIRFLPVIDENHKNEPAKWGEELHRQLWQRQQFESMPEPERSRFVAALRSGKRENALRLLAKLYPDWKSQFLKKGALNR